MLRVLFLAFSLFSLTAFADQKPVVSYMYLDKPRGYVASKTPDGYLFNPDGKRTIDIATVNWPPYIGPDLCNHGWAFQLAVAVLTSQDYAVNVRFLPWSRAVFETEQGKADILFPEYFIEKTAPSDYFDGVARNQLLSLSTPIPGGNVVFMKRNGEEIPFNGQLTSIKGMKIGVVRGYQNFPEFDAMMDNQQFRKFEAIDDLQLMKLLVGKRVDLVIGDPKVLRHTVAHSTLPQMTKDRILNEVTQVQPILRYNPLYFAVSKGKPGWQTLRNDINTSLLHFIRSGELHRIFTDSDQCSNKN